MNKAVCALAAGLILIAPAIAQQRPPQAPQPPRPAQAGQKDKERTSPLAGFGASSKEPIKIDADRLDVFDREGRAVFSGNVVAVQGESTMRCSALIVFYEQTRGQGQGQGQTAALRQPGAPHGQNEAIKKIDCQGPVTIVSKTQTATGDNATYDKAANKVILTGNVALSEGSNVMRGERIVYDLDAGVANIDPKSGERVKALIVPGSGGLESGPKAEASKPADQTPKPKPQRPASAQAN